MTVLQVLARTKTVTRRVAWTWTDLKPGDRLLLIEKGMGLPKGSHQVVIAKVEILANDVIPLRDMDQAECDAEGFPEMGPAEFVAFWLDAHRSQLGMHPSHATSHDVMCRRIKWRYITED